MSTSAVASAAADSHILESVPVAGGRFDLGLSAASALKLHPENKPFSWPFFALICAYHIWIGGAICRSRSLMESKK